ncbi:unnamed protein product [Cunninghamella blakesleeana]
MTYSSNINTIYSFQHQQACENLLKDFESTNISLWIPNSKQPTQHITLHGKHKHKKAFIYGSIYCRDALTIDIICKAKADSSSSKHSSTTYWWLILLFYGCYLATSSFIMNHIRKKHIILHIKLDANYIQYSFQHMNMIGYRFTWRAAAKEDMVSFASVYFSVLGGAYSSLGKYSVAYASKAENIAKRQIKLAKWLQDPILECKCWLYYAEDLILQGKLKKSIRILNKQQQFAERIQNPILLTMCDSVQLKLNTATKI